MHLTNCHGGNKSRSKSGQLHESETLLLNINTPKREHPTKKNAHSRKQEMTNADAGKGVAQLQFLDIVLYNCSVAWYLLGEIRETDMLYVNSWRFVAGNKSG